MNPGGVQLGALLMGLLGGLALFLFGLERMSEALKNVAGSRLQALLRRLTRNRFLAALSGAFATAVIQSSSVTTVLVVGFISARLLTLTQSVGVIMGANVGTTITAQIVAFKVTKASLLLIAVGFAVTLLGQRRSVRQRGEIVLGLGLIFLGMTIMGDAMSPLRSFQPFLDAMTRLEAPLLGIVAGALFTALVQSSSATTALVIAMASQGLVSLPAGIALTLGANIGTCATALLAAIGKPREAVRAATVHVLFNVLGVAVWLPFVGRLADLVVSISPRADNLDGLARLAAETPRQIANAHTVFNVVNTVLFLGFTAQLARVAEWLVGDRPAADERAIQAKYLDAALLPTPSLALDRVRLEILHMSDHIGAMMQRILPAIFDGEPESLDRIERMDDAVDALHGQVVTFLGKISQEPLTDAETDELLQLLEAANSLENVGDIIETNLVALGKERIALRVRISDETRHVIERFHGAALSALVASVQATTQKSAAAARQVVEMKQEINRLADEAARHQARRLVAEEPNRLPAYTVETDVMQNLKRIYYFTKRIARAAVPAIEA